MDINELRIEYEKYTDKMSGMERMMAYAKGEEVDHIPLTVGGGETMAHFLGYTVGEFRRSFEVQCEVLEYCAKNFAGSMMGSAPMGLKGIGEALGSTIKYPENSLDYVDDFILKDYDMIPELKGKINRDNPFVQQKLAKMHKYKEHYGEKFPVATNVAGPLTTAVSIRKTELVMKDMIKRPDDVHRLLDLAVSASLDWLKIVKEEFGTCMAGFAEPAAANNLISAQKFREFGKPHLQELLAGMKELMGRTPGTHICGRTKAIWQDLAELGLPSFSVDNCEDLAELKAAVGDKMSISGNVPPVEVMRNGTIDDVIASVQQCLIKGADSPRGFTLAIGCQIPIGTPKENIDAYLYAARRYGRGAKKGQLPRGLYEEGLVK